MRWAKKRNDLGPWVTRLPVLPQRKAKLSRKASAPVLKCLRLRQFSFVGLLFVEPSTRILNVRCLIVWSILRKRTLSRTKRSRESRVADSWKSSIALSSQASQCPAGSGLDLKGTNTVKTDNTFENGSCDTLKAAWPRRPTIMIFLTGPGDSIQNGIRSKPQGMRSAWFRVALGSTKVVTLGSLRGACDSSAQDPSGTSPGAASREGGGSAADGQG